MLDMIAIRSILNSYLRVTRGGDKARCRLPAMERLRLCVHLIDVAEEYSTYLLMDESSVLDARGAILSPNIRVRLLALLKLIMDRHRVLFCQQW